MVEPLLPFPFVRDIQEVLAIVKTLKPESKFELTQGLSGWISYSIREDDLDKLFEIDHKLRLKYADRIKPAIMDLGAKEQEAFNVGYQKGKASAQR